jgi:hypothetical protein
MEESDLKSLIYFVLAILWVVYSFFKKNKGAAAKEEKESPRPISNEKVKEVIQKKKVMEPLLNHPHEKLDVKPISKANKLLKERNKQKEIQLEELETGNENQETKTVDIDAEKMIIYSEILKTPYL